MFHDNKTFSHQHSENVFQMLSRLQMKRFFHTEHFITLWFCNTLKVDGFALTMREHIMERSSVGRFHNDDKGRMF